MNKENISIKNISFRYSNQDKNIFDNFSIEIKSTEFVGIIGSNGSGKSTLLKVLLGFYEPRKGSILFWGKPLNKVRNQIGYLSQFEEIDFDFPISLFQIVLSGLLKGKFINKYTDDDKQKVTKIMKELGIWKLRNKQLQDLSGGQKQRVFLARALVNNPKLLVLDEPLSSLDIKMQKDFYELLKVLNKDITIIVVDHNIEMLKKYATKIICVDRCEKDTYIVHSDNLDKLSH